MTIILYVGETHVTFNAAWTDDAGSPVDLTNPDTTNAVLSLRWGSNTRGIASRDGDGTFSGGPRNTGHFKYAVSANDVAAANVWLMQFKATYADGTVLFADPITEETREAI
jgi:hypothetical protein